MHNFAVAFNDAGPECADALADCVRGNRCLRTLDLCTGSITISIGVNRIGYEGVLKILKSVISSDSALKKVTISMQSRKSHVG